MEFAKITRLKFREYYQIYSSLLLQAQSELTVFYYRLSLLLQTQSSLTDSVSSYYRLSLLSQTQSALIIGSVFSYRLSQLLL